ncbi:hypothetical protein [Salinibaculum rarum]|uniref:hypothetical protein n=1 Tax=Salinibaculum rarum TaxID=3058903 RepID=UPI00265EC4EA|nr:hypothetical protein [Salinibaculum sp. KK48]
MPTDDRNGVKNAEWEIGITILVTGIGAFLVHDVAKSIGGSQSQVLSATIVAVVAMSVLFYHQLGEIRAVTQENE